MTGKNKPRAKAWQPVPYENADIGALKALAEGTAEPHQQQRALHWIVQVASNVHDEPFRSDGEGGERETAFALGRAFVGRQILKLVGAPLDIVEKMRKSD